VSFSALFDAVNNPAKTLVGSLKHIEIMLAIKSIIQILFILIFMNTKFNL